VTRLRIDVRRGDQVAPSIEPDGDVVRIGRSEGNDIRVDGRGIAAFHALLLRQDDEVLLQDLGAGGGTAIRRSTELLLLGEQDSRKRLSPGDVILIGDPEGDPAEAVQLTVTLEPEDDTPRVVQVRAIETLPHGSGASLGDEPTLRAIWEVQRAVGAAAHLPDVLSAVLDGALALVPRATHATAILRDEQAAGEKGDAGFVPVLTRVRGPSGRGDTPREPVRVARSVYRKVVRERAAVLAADAPEGELSTESLLGASIRSTIAVPLWKADELVGVLQIDNRAAPAMFTSADVDRMAVLSTTASLAVANARLIDRLCLAEEQLERENRFLKGRERARRGALEMVGQSAVMRSLSIQLDKVAATRASVLIEGETGSGKELVASAVHYRSRRRERLFVPQNCAALPEQLLESELFGHRRGAFTGATEDRKGLFELADGGTLFLDEVTEMPLALQAKLLRVLQEGEVRPLGATQTRVVDVRIVTATNRLLEDEVKAGRFREDLFYRLKVFPVRVPPLRERREDVPLLAGHFLGRYATEMAKPVAGYSQEAMELLMAYEWPGNVRQLENEVQRAVIEVDAGAFIGAEHLSASVRKMERLVSSAGVAPGTLKDMVDQVERHFVQEALRAHGNNKTSAARALGITREGLHKKLRQLGLS
jgi:Nif-specific regulatory protein